MPNKEEGSYEERLQSMRERLYSRGAPPREHAREILPDTPQVVKKNWDMGVEPPAPRGPAVVAPRDEVIPNLSNSMRSRRRSFRITAIFAGLIFFVVALLLSGSFLFFGKNMISGNNISIQTSGPFAVGGGEEIPIQITIANKNAVPIESATLIIEYPFGTQSATEDGKELFRDRKQLELIKPGEVLNVPLKARVFGEENEEKSVLASIEYRVQGSNATFYKEAEPLRFKISSSPVVLSVDNVTKTASGQEVELAVTISSNAPSVISDILLKAEYPFGFDFSSATPEPVSGRDTWTISNLKPEEKKTITIKGLLIGKQDDTQSFKFSVGVPNERDRYSLASIFTTQSKEISIEAPFLDIAVLVDGKEDATPVIAPESLTQISIVFTNSLSTTLYDGKISVDLSGNGLNESEVRVEGGGFYDSKTNIATWDQNTTDSLSALAPGRSSTVTFSVTPHGASVADRTPQISLTVNAEGDRVSEDQVSQRLTGAISKTIKVESVAKLLSRALYSTGAFPNTGPVPPRAEEVTTYTMVWYVKNGTNAITDGIVTATIPAYVTWLDLTTTAPVFSYNPDAREVTWKVGDLKAGEDREASFQVSIRPSLTQVGQVVTLLNEQRLRAVDRFTGTTIRAEAPALTTQLFADPEYEDSDGRVNRKSR